MPNDAVRILFIGDIVGKPGRRAVRELLPELKSHFSIDFTIANIENAAGGAGLTEKILKELISYGVDVFTSGNHIWDKKEIFDFIDNYPQLLRPANFHPEAPGRGHGVFETETGQSVCVINLIGRLFTGLYDSPFVVGDRILEQVDTPIKIIDFHAETTSEKQVAGFYFNGRVSAVIGTHTHVQTSDERILDKGTAYITDVGMTGGLESVIGIKPDKAMRRFVKGLPSKYEPSNKRIGLEGIFLVVDTHSGQAKEIKRLRRLLP